LDVLNCANDNSQLTIQHALAALKPLMPLLDSLKPITEIAQIPLELPALGEIVDGATDGNITETIKKLRQAITAIDQVVQGLCP
jgi:hypothetical protein